ncbi:MAG: MATE family efflux transporter [Cytophagaceae bacterium]|nr:MATE family efflux transporter [Cytophagaceae bacterium]MDW8455441.1 MATE family efflux transporter [Cytophagaceae bacterium]
MQIKSEQTEIMNADLRKLVWKLSLPSIASMVLLGFNNLSDTFLIARFLGNTALSGAALASPLVTIVIGIGYWIGTGAAHIISNALGENDSEEQEKTLSSLLLLNFILCLFIVLPFYIYAEPLLKMIGSKGEALIYASAYLRTTLYLAPVWVYALSLHMIIRSEGKIKEAAWMIGRGLLVNMVCTSIFLGIFKTGIEGAAWGTHIGMITLTAEQIFYFKNKNSSIRGNIFSWCYYPKTVNQLLACGLPAFIFNLMSFIQAAVVFHIVTQIGTQEEVAFYAMSNVLYLFLMTPMYGFMRAYQPVAGINYGARLYMRVRKGFYIFSFASYVFILPLWLLIILLPELTVGLLLPEYTLHKADVINLRLYFSSVPLLPVMFMALSLFPSVKVSHYATAVVSVRQLLLYIPAMLLFSYWLGISGIYAGSSLVNLLVFIGTIYLLYKCMTKLNENDGQCL